MYARIARFEGGTASAIKEESRRILDDIAAAQRGQKGSYAPDLGRLVSRIEVLADRQQGKVAVIVYCDTEEDLREADRILAGMSPQNSDWGRRVSSDTYELLGDESVAARRVA